MTASIYDRVMKNVRIHLPGALDDALKLEMFNVLDEFYTDSSIWKEEVVFPVVTDDVEYAIQAESSNAARIIRLDKVLSAAEFPVRATMDEPGVIVLDSEPDEDQDYVATVVLSVGDPVDRDDYPFSPTWIIDKYFLGIADGVLSRLMAQPAKPYTNERYAILHARKFRIAVAQARVDALHANLQRGRRWSFPTGFSTTRRQ